MGVYAESSIQITCKNNKSAQEVKSRIIQKKEEMKEDFNYDFTKLEVAKGDNEVFLDKSSERVQNLEYQIEELWKLVKNIPGVEELNAPIMVEGDGLCFSNPTECDNVDCKGNPKDIQKVTMKKEFEGGEVNWCKKCRERDNDFIAIECGNCGRVIDEDEEGIIISEGKNRCPRCANL